MERIGSCSPNNDINNNNQVLLLHNTKGTATANCKCICNTIWYRNGQFSVNENLLETECFIQYTNISLQVKVLQSKFHLSKSVEVFSAALQ